MAVDNNELKNERMNEDTPDFCEDSMYSTYYVECV